MAKRKRMERGRTKEERKEKRSKLGALKDILVADTTQVRYCEAVMRFFVWMLAFQVSLPSDIILLDEILSDYIETCWQDGEPLYWCLDLLSGLQHFMPHLKRQLNMGWRMCVGWSRHELPRRAPPMPFDIFLGLVGLAVELGHLEMAAALGLGFLGMMRTGEIFAVQCKHFSIKGDIIVVSLTQTKTSVRKKAYEIVSFKSRIMAIILSKIIQGRSPEGKLILETPTKMRMLLAAYLLFLHLSDIGFSWYSLRRGGATKYFTDTGSMEKALLKGRWESVRTARVYINDGLAALTLLKCPNDTLAECKALFNKVYSKLVR